MNIKIKLKLKLRSISMPNASVAWSTYCDRAHRAEGGIRSAESVSAKGSPLFVFMVRCIATANHSELSAPSWATSTRFQMLWSVAVGRPDRLSTGAILLPLTLPSFGLIPSKMVSYLAFSLELTVHGGLALPYLGGASDLGSAPTRLLVGGAVAARGGRG